MRIQGVLFLSIIPPKFLIFDLKKKIFQPKVILQGFKGDIKWIERNFPRKRHFADLKGNLFVFLNGTLS